ASSALVLLRRSEEGERLTCCGAGVALAECGELLGLDAADQADEHGLAGRGQQVDPGADQSVTADDVPDRLLCIPERLLEAHPDRLDEAGCQCGDRTAVRERQRRGELDALLLQ